MQRHAKSDVEPTFKGRRGDKEQNQQSVGCMPQNDRGHALKFVAAALDQSIPGRVQDGRQQDGKKDYRFQNIRLQERHDI